MLARSPGTVITDAWYGSEENYAYLEHEEIQAVVKYGSYHAEKSKAFRKDVSKIENWTYNSGEDTRTCLAGQTLVFRRESKETTESGYEIHKRHYRSLGREGCPLKPRCIQKSFIKSRHNKTPGYSPGVANASGPSGCTGAYPPLI
ncbi:hypothetical protein GCM10010912_55880 [Paenibacillus albidus]|uniref:Transposase IS4-like domain-containing protein n=2 Tax=Paenibacillus albidus TaxID=2041023 RepID=A0A917FVA3_9BACL|nr:hypothetical protein GCM10010912_55880 [Paenibacillus albidus]